MTAKVLNIDELLSKAEPAYTIRVNGEDHHAKQPSVEDFLANLKDLEALAAAPDLGKEIEATIRMIVRAFPTLTEVEVRSWPVEAIERLFMIIQGFDKTEAEVVGDSEGNAQAAS